MTLNPENFVPPTKEDLAQDRLADLTAEERDAIAEAEAEEAAELKAADEGKAKVEAEAAGAEEAAAKAKADADAKAKADADAKVAADAKAEAEAKAKAKAETGEEGEDKPEAEAKAETEQPHSPRQAVPDWQAPADADAKLKEIAVKRSELGKKFNVGEIDVDQLLAEQDDLNKQERVIERAQDRAEMAVEMVQAVWLKSTVPAFLDANKHYRDNATLHGMLDAEVRRLQVAAGKEGKDPLDPSILVEADKAIKTSLTSLGVAPKPAKETEETAEETEQPAKQGKPGVKQTIPALPPTLGKIPASEINGTDSKYSSLDRLAVADPAAYEDAYAKLPQAERDAYLTKQ